MRRPNGDDPAEGMNVECRLFEIGRMDRQSGERPEELTRHLQHRLDAEGDMAGPGRAVRASRPSRWRRERPAGYARSVPRLVGINHVALEVESVDDALEFYGRIFDLELRGRSPRMAFIDIGDQFIALSEGRAQPPDRARHFGLVVDDKEATRQALIDAGVELQPGRGLDFLDPWGNHVQVVDYRDVQFTKTPEILGGMGLDDLDKSDSALEELREKGLSGTGG